MRGRVVLSLAAAPLIAAAVLAALAAQPAQPGLDAEGIAEPLAGGGAAEGRGGGDDGSGAGMEVAVHRGTITGNGLAVGVAGAPTVHQGDLRVHDLGPLREALVSLRLGGGALDAGRVAPQGAPKLLLQFHGVPGDPDVVAADGWSARLSGPAPWVAVMAAAPGMVEVPYELVVAQAPRGG